VGYRQLKMDMRFETWNEKTSKRIGEAELVSSGSTRDQMGHG
jgi:hypothetical protein